MTGYAGHQGRADATERPAPALHQAEEVYLDCLSRFGLNSAEAHVARVIWCDLRSRSLRTSHAS